jgi:DNA-binding MarR family transcriptional regulator
MPTDLRDELRQTRPFVSLHQEAHLNIARTEAVLGDALERVLKAHGIGTTQYNVLRILRGAGPDGLCRNEIRDRLLTRMPDVTRLLDRMEEAELVTRARGTDDRRLVSTRLTARGRRLVDSLDAPVAEEHRRRLGHMSEAQLKALVELLTLARRTN